jgi:hypothetical protein
MIAPLAAGCIAALTGNDDRCGGINWSGETVRFSFPLVISGDCAGVCDDCAAAGRPTMRISIAMTAGRRGRMRGNIPESCQNVGA